MLQYISKHTVGKGRGIRTRANTPTSGHSDILIGIGWNKVVEKGAPPLDLDLHLALCGASGEALDLVYPQKQVSSCGAAHHTGDNIDGEGPGWDEAVGYDTSKLRPEVASIEAFVVIDQATERDQHLGMVTGGYLSAINNRADELAHRPLSVHEGATGLVIARARRVDNWDLRFPLEGASFAEIISSLGIAA